MKTQPARALCRALIDIGRGRGIALVAGCFAAAVAMPAHAGESVTTWSMSTGTYTESQRPLGPNVLGTVALPIRTLPTSTRWSKLMLASLDQPSLRRFVAGAQDLGPHDQLAFVQSAVNHAVYTSNTFDDCSDHGYWRPAQETLASGRGNCFDVAIAKMEALRMLGMRGADLYLTTGYFHSRLIPSRRRESVALLVRTGESFWLLPEHSNDAIEITGATTESCGFTPMLTYGVGMTWIHGRVVKPASLDEGGGQAATLATAQ